jgi:mono/diheme cytochrome c family protein
MRSWAVIGGVCAALSLSWQAQAIPLGGLTPPEAEELYHLAEGAEAMPLLWLKALESPLTHRPFLEQPERFGLLADPANTDGLPVGLSVTVTADMEFTGVRLVGASCAACHVGEVRYRGKALRIIGGPGMFNADRFRDEVVGAMTETAKHPTKLMQFVKRLIELEKQHVKAISATVPSQARSPLRDHLPSLVKDAGPGSLGDDVREQLAQALPAKGPTKLSDKLRAAVQKASLSGHAMLAKLDPLKRIDALQSSLDGMVQTARLLEARAKAFAHDRALARRKKPVEDGPGRVDAFGGVLYRFFSEQGVPPPFAPTSNPELWDVKRTPWFHYDGNTDSIVERNFGNAQGLGFVFDEKTHVSTALPRSLARAEYLFWKISPPVWPPTMLGAIDAQKKAQGEKLYAKYCAGCHVNKVFELMDPAAVGTSPLRARTTMAEVSDGKGGKANALVLAAAQLKDIIRVAFAKSNIGPDEVAKMRFGRPEKSTWRGTGKIKIPSLSGVFATAPYLHNGSVPTLYDLLLPGPARPKKFYVGGHELDPAKVGFVTKSGEPNAFLFDTSIAGNANSGHEYGTKLSEPERWALVEYLKTL